MQLTEYKERCEWALEVKTLPQEVVMECLALREQRSNIDLVADVTESELKKVHTCAHVHMIIHVHVYSVGTSCCFSCRPKGFLEESVEFGCPSIVQ